MTEAKTQFKKVSLEELKKILPDQVTDGNDHRKDNQKDKKKNKRQLAEARKPKSKA